MKKYKLILAILTMSFIITSCGDEVYEGRHTKNKEEKEVTKEDKEDKEDKKDKVTPVAVEAENKEDDNEDNQADHGDIVFEDDNQEDSSGESNDEIRSLINQKQDVIKSDADAIERNKSIYEINSEICDLNTYDFSNTRITFFGDSITYGVGGDINEYNNPVSYVDYVRDELGCITTNKGVPGMPISFASGSYESMVFREEEAIAGDTDIIVLFGGVNDYLAPSTVMGDDSYEENTFMGDTKKLFSHIRERFPDTKVYVVLIYRGEYETKVSAGTDYKINDFLQIERDLAAEYDFDVIDFYTYDLLNGNNEDVRNTYFYDSVHPNNEGYVWLGKYIAAELVQDNN